MLNTAAWPRKTLNVKDELFLDAKNVRLETTTAQVEADIIEDLFDNEGAFNLVDAIVRVGYLTHEIPIVVKRKGKYVVVEGNRRLAALKAIQNPMLVPGYHQRVAALAKSLTTAQRTALERIEVQIALNEAQASQVVAALHTSNPRKPWTPARQAAFFQSQIDVGRKYKLLVDRYPTIDVEEFVLRARLVNRLKSSVVADAELTDYVQSKGFKGTFSTLTRILESKEFIEITGIGLDANGELDTVLTDAEFDAACVIIVQGLADGSVNTRTINTVGSPRFTQLMGEIRKATGTASATATGAGTGGTQGGGQTGKASGAGQGGASGGGGQATGKAGKKAAAPKKKSKQNFLSIGHIVVPTAYPTALRLHVEELSIINIQRNPNSTFLLLRAVLEKSIKSYADAKGVDIAKTKHNNGGYVQLHNCLTWLVEYWQKNGPQPLLQPTKKLLGGKVMNFGNTKDALNAVNHNHHYLVDGDDVIGMWDSMDSVMRELMKP